MTNSVIQFNASQFLLLEKFLLSFSRTDNVTVCCAWRHRKLVTKSKGHWRKGFESKVRIAWEFAECNFCFLWNPLESNWKCTEKSYRLSSSLVENSLFNGPSRERHLKNVNYCNCFLWERDRKKSNVLQEKTEGNHTKAMWKLLLSAAQGTLPSV